MTEQITGNVYWHLELTVHDGMLERDFIALLLVHLGHAMGPVLMFEAGARRGTGIDSDGIADAAAVISQLKQHDLSRASSDGDGLNDASFK